MPVFELSTHVKERALERGIGDEVIKAVLSAPDSIVDDALGGLNQKVYQALVDFPGKGTYLVRVFVNCGKQPNVVKTVYKTSKISKYL